MEAAILLVYGAALALLAGFGLHRFRLLFLFLRHRRETANRPAAPGALPRVTVQLPVYNELYVVERLIRAVCALDYPRDLLEVQVLDDSTDETSAVAARLCLEQRALGVDIAHVHRDTRDGYKAGALAAGLARARGELIAIFDADFVPPPGFLKALVPQFADPRVGMVQARWSHLNRDYSLLTRIQAILLDGHFVIEQTARSRAGLLFNFNGTAGVWRRQTLEDAGGWQSDTLTEDLDLSYRAQMRGWRFVYLPETAAPAELPVEVRAFKSQQRRWAKGSAQTARKHLPRLLAGSLPARAKVESVLHLMSNTSYVAIMALSLLALPALVVSRQAPVHWAAIAAVNLVLFACSTASVAAFYWTAQRAAVPSRRERAAAIPLVMALGIGLSVSGSWSVIEGLLGRGREFVRTPKYAIVAPTDGWRGRRYVNRRDFSGVVEILMAIYFAIILAYTIAHRLFFFAPLAVLFLCGFLYVGSLSLIEHANGFAASRRRPGRSRPLLPTIAPPLLAGSPRPE